jgi:hypothetical protein
LAFADKAEYANGEVQRLTISTSSGANWPITEPARLKLLADLTNFASESFEEVYPAKANSTRLGPKPLSELRAEVEECKESCRSLTSSKVNPMKIVLRFKYTRVHDDATDFQYPHYHTLKWFEATELAAVLEGTATAAHLRDFLPIFMRLPRQGSAHTLNLQDESRRSETLNDCLLRLGQPDISLEAKAAQARERAEAAAEAQAAADAQAAAEAAAEAAAAAANATNTTNTTAATNATSSGGRRRRRRRLNTTDTTGTTDSSAEIDQLIIDRINNLGESLQQYWSIQCGRDRSDAGSAARLNDFELFAISAKVSIGQYVIAGGILALYSLLVVYLSSTVRTMFSGGSANTMFYDWPRHDVIKQYVVKIAECRALASLTEDDLRLFRRRSGVSDSTTAEDAITPLEAEEEYFRELIDIYRRPDLLYERTGPARHYFGYGSQAESRFHKQTQRLELRPEHAKQD